MRERSETDGCELMSSLQPAQELDLILNAIEERLEPTKEQISQFKLDVLFLVEPKLPSVARAGLVEGRRFAAGVVAHSVISDALAQCWAYADEQWPGGGLETKEACAVRSVISLLHGLVSQEVDFVDSISFFLALINRVEPHFSEEARLLEQRFLG